MSVRSSGRRSTRIPGASSARSRSWATSKESLAVIPGNVPNLINLPVGCRFAPRCLTRVDEDVTLATEAHPELLPVAPGHAVRCWLYHDQDGRPIPRPEVQA